jgi:hypothetical protein
LFDIDKLDTKLVSSYDITWQGDVTLGKYDRELFLPKYKRVLNCFEDPGGSDLNFPFSLFSLEYMKRWNMGDSQVRPINIYVGNPKPRLKKTLSYGIPTEVYGGSARAMHHLVEKFPTMVYKNKCTMKTIPDFLHEALCIIINIDEHRKNLGWVLNRYLEAHSCRIPCLFHEDVFPDNIWSVELTDESKGFNLSDDAIPAWFELLLDDYASNFHIGYRLKLRYQQGIILSSIFHAFRQHASKLLRDIFKKALT